MFSNVDYSVLCVFGDKLSNTKLKHSFKTPFQSLNAALQGLEGVEVRHSETRKKITNSPTVLRSYTKFSQKAYTCLNLTVVVLHVECGNGN